MNRYFIHLTYKGTNYHGWQRQENANSIQAELEKCLGIKLNAKIDIMGCGRTDTGVHAQNFYAHFDHETLFDEDNLQKLTADLNRFLPADIALFSIWKVSQDAHARFDAIERTYHYHIHQSKAVFKNELSYYIFGKLDVNEMNKAAGILLEYNDFTSFAKLHSQTKTNLCIIKAATWIEQADGLVFVITADRFLRNMVRAIVGSLLEVGQGKRTIDEFRQLIEAKNRNEAGYSVPAHALFLHDVKYPVSF